MIRSRISGNNSLRNFFQSVMLVMTMVCASLFLRPWKWGTYKPFSGGPKWGALGGGQEACVETNDVLFLSPTYGWSYPGVRLEIWVCACELLGQESVFFRKGRTACNYHPDSVSKMPTNSGGGLVTRGRVLKSCPEGPRPHTTPWLLLLPRKHYPLDSENFKSGNGNQK